MLSSVNSLSNASILIVDTGRKGEMRQCEALANACGLPWRFTKNDQIPPDEPTLILSFGRALRQAWRLKAAFGGRPLIIQLGRPRLKAPSELDLILLMPQDDYPEGPQTLHLNMPLNGADLSRPAIPADTTQGPVSVLLGGPTRHFSFSDNDAQVLLSRAERLAAATGTALRVVPGPRTPDHVMQIVEERYRQTPDRIDRRPLSTVLAESGRLVVTADSASLIADAWRTGKPTWLYPLPVRLPPVQRLKIMADRITPELRHTLIRRGWLAGGTDFSRWHRALVQQGLVRPLTEQGLKKPDWHMPFPIPDEELRACRDRVIALIADRKPASSRAER
ncbi:ELM1/GtrOC1 family putative glycosyltransferase [Acetobacter sp. UBA5411]|uniref:ELM1/GtrOC1 family putative glycosyltransferase n=1 Tax=Acetobacter sp. UBA5411 TaxID=1945905 RepID=UPI0025BE9FA1|nr:ELM1/GtrOC1 family putative glycosyltransferase [Acetobacter sp. UBA5411]